MMDAEKKDYQALESVFLFVAAFINRSTEHKTTEPIRRVHASYSEIAVDVMGDDRSGKVAKKSLIA